MQTKCPNCGHVFFTEPVYHAPVIRCVDCGVVIAQYEHYHDYGIEGWGYRDTIERANSFDSSRCGKCCVKLMDRMEKK